MTFSDVERVFEWAKRVWRWIKEMPEEERHYLFARMFVPSLGLGIGAMFLFGVGPAAESADQLVAVPMQSSVSATDIGVEDETGVVFIFKGSLSEEEGKFGVGWQRSSPEKIILSADPAIVKANRSRLELAETGLEIYFPLEGLSPPLLVTAPAVPEDSIVVSGTKVPLSSLRMATEEFGALSVAVSLCAAFFLGLTSVIPRVVH